jgi:hypothetical protein
MHVVVVGRDCSSWSQRHIACIKNVCHCEDSQSENLHMHACISGGGGSYDTCMHPRWQRSTKFRHMHEFLMHECGVKIGGLLRGPRGKKGSPKHAVCGTQYRVC